jgi:WD40 repeat protein
LYLAFAKLRYTGVVSQRLFSTSLIISCHLCYAFFWQSGSPVATFKHHTQPVTTVEWHPTEATVFASGGCDDQIALWDLALERDSEACEDDIRVS